MSTFVARPLMAAPSQLALAQPGSHAVGAVTLDSPAETLMTDLRQLPAIRIAEDRTLADAQSHMLSAGVRLLFVVDTKEQLVGFISAYDLAGEKPLQTLLARGSHVDLHAPNQVLVSDIMQPVASWRGIDYVTVGHSRLGDVVETFREHRAPHLLVFETTTDEQSVVRGLFSATQIERALDLKLETVARPDSFAAIGQVLSRI